MFCTIPMLICVECVVLAADLMDLAIIQQDPHLSVYLLFLMFPITKFHWHLHQKTISNRTADRQGIFVYCISSSLEFVIHFFFK